VAQAMIPSFAAQALQKVFRFRPLTDELRPLRDPTDYELLRAYIASGEQIATTFYGPVRFDAYGQNQGRRPTTLQVDEAGRPKVVFPVEIAEKGFSFPAPASLCEADAWRLEYGDACLLCAPVVCQPEKPQSEDVSALLGGVLGGGLGLLLLLFVLITLLMHKRLKAKKENDFWLLLDNSGKKATIRKPGSLAQGSASNHVFLSYTAGTVLDCPAPSLCACTRALRRLYSLLDCRHGTRAGPLDSEDSAAHVP
jgi:hypothetical protein